MTEGDRSLTYGEFARVDIRAGRIVDVQPFPEARRPAYKLWVDLGPEFGVRKTSAQITRHYSPEQLTGTLVAAVVNFPPKQIGPFMSELLVVGFPDTAGEVVLLRPDREVPVGGKLF